MALAKEIRIVGLETEDQHLDAITAIEEDPRNYHAGTGTMPVIFSRAQAKIESIYNRIDRLFPSAF